MNNELNKLFNKAVEYRGHRPTESNAVVKVTQGRAYSLRLSTNYPDIYNHTLRKTGDSQFLSPPIFEMGALLTQTWLQLQSLAWCHE
jgi:hypothetical protein